MARQVFLRIEPHLFVCEQCGQCPLGIYNRAAKVVLSVVDKKSEMPHELVCQHLDDVCAAAVAGSGLAQRFDAMYSDVAKEIRVKLAPRDDPESHLAPRQQA